MDLVASATETAPKGSDDLGAIAAPKRALLAQAENTPRLAGETIYRHACECNPNEPDALARTSGSVRGARGDSGPYRHRLQAPWGKLPTIIQAWPPS